MASTSMSVIYVSIDEWYTISDSSLILILFTDYVSESSNIDEQTSLFYHIWYFSVISFLRFHR